MIASRPLSNIREWEIEGVAALLDAIAKPCDCELGRPDPQVCVAAPIRWEQEWAAGGRRSFGKEANGAA
jgi:hypothetical protein